MIFRKVFIVTQLPFLQTFLQEAARQVDLERKFLTSGQVPIYCFLKAMMKKIVFLWLQGSQRKDISKV